LIDGFENPSTLAACRVGPQPVQPGHWMLS
jgi:hypothetical protein